MKFDRHKHHRRSIRLKGYDYGRAGYYFVTICVNRGLCLLGDVTDGVMVPNDAGKMVTACWYDLAQRFASVELGQFVVMPNHVHGIIIIESPDEQTEEKQYTLGNIVGAFKSISTHQYIKDVHERDWESFHKRLWQRNYHEHIIRNDRGFEAISAYIISNPSVWKEDSLHPDVPPNQFNKLWQTEST